MPSTNYTVAVTLNGQGASAWGPGSGGSSAQCVAFDAAVISTTQFSITFRLCGTGAATNVTPNAAHVGWIAIQNN
jgi:hypothetical protein